MSEIVDNYQYWTIMKKNEALTIYKYVYEQVVELKKIADACEREGEHCIKYKNVSNQCCNVREHLEGLESEEFINVLACEDGLCKYLHPHYGCQCKALGCRLYYCQSVNKARYDIINPILRRFRYLLMDLQLPFGHFIDYEQLVEKLDGSGFFDDSQQQE